MEPTVYPAFLTPWETCKLLGTNSRQLLTILRPYVLALALPSSGARRDHRFPSAYVRAYRDYLQQRVLPPTPTTAKAFARTAEATSLVQRLPREFENSARAAATGSYLGVDWVTGSLNVCDNTVRKWCNSPTLPSRKSGRILSVEVEAFIKAYQWKLPNT